MNESKIIIYTYFLYILQENLYMIISLSSTPQHKCLIFLIFSPPA